ncbi:hypothetical protein SPMU_16800 [Sphingomonas mucosissima]|uniref:Uncharacterized protein n=1 Tax=Sphingomonas mucosissima TaxID=370959 RepID=A0A245ZLS7_9SPHN|nr:hypothetical protein SPMU_16800 [Sphingomonas mucosissima]
MRQAIVIPGASWHDEAAEECSRCPINRVIPALCRDPRFHTLNTLKSAARLMPEPARHGPMRFADVPYDGQRRFNPLNNNPHS